MTITPVPDFRLTLGDLDLTPRIKGTVTDTAGRQRPRLVSLTLTEKRGEEADQLDLVLDDTDGQIALPPTGATLSLALGWRQGTGVAVGLVDNGTFIVDEVAHAGPPDLITIRARSADFTGGLKTRRERSWHATTLGAIVADVAKAHGLIARCAPALAGVAVKAKAQSRESDLAFLRRLGREHDAVATIKRGTLIVSPKGAGVTPSGQPLPTITLTRAAGDRHSYSRQKREEAEGATAIWHDRASGARKTVTAGKADGAKRLAKVYPNEAAARTAARTAQGRAGREPASLELTLALGRADLHPEQRIAISGYKGAIDGTRWLIGEVTQSLSERGYSTALKLEWVG